MVSAQIAVVDELGKTSPTKKLKKHAKNTKKKNKVNFDKFVTQKISL